MVRNLISSCSGGIFGLVRLHVAIVSDIFNIYTSLGGVDVIMSLVCLTSEKHGCERLNGWMDDFIVDVKVDNDSPAHYLQSKSKTTFFGGKMKEIRHILSILSKLGMYHKCSLEELTQKYRQSKQDQRSKRFGVGPQSYSIFELGASGVCFQEGHGSATKKTTWVLVTRFHFQCG